MSVLGINLGVAIGQVVPSPAPPFLTEALQSVEVTCNDDGPSGFQLTFHADRSPGRTTDYALLSTSLLRPSNRVVLTVTLNGAPQVLMDGIITRQELAHSAEASAATLVITGEDISVMMDLVECSMAYPGMGDAVIAEVVLAKYALFGVIPVVVPTLSGLTMLPIERVPQQMATDRKYLQQLAQQHGYIFHVKPGPAHLTNIAYWGPPIRVGQQQKALTVDMGPATNVETISFQYDALAPTLVAGLVQDAWSELDLPVVTFGASPARRPALADRPALPGNLPFVRMQQFSGAGLTYLEALECATATTDRSTDQVVVAQGSVDALRYGAVLAAPGLVGLRGVGYSYDGAYYVKQVTHRIRRGDYQQLFTLTREGLGSLTAEVQP